MNTPNVYNDAAIRRTVAAYNMIPNLLWSAVNLTPVYIFCYKYLSVQLVYMSSAISLLTICVPASFFAYIRLSKARAVYKKIGVKFINKFTQNGYFINGLIRKRFPRYNVITAKGLTHKRALQKTYMFEKFHFVMFVFFTLTTVFSLLKNEILWALVLFVTNLAYNIYPIFLQQYMRMRLNSFDKRRIQVRQKFMPGKQELVYNSE